MFPPKSLCHSRSERAQNAATAAGGGRTVGATDAVEESTYSRSLQAPSHVDVESHASHVLGQGGGGGGEVSWWGWRALVEWWKKFKGSGVRWVLTLRALDFEP